MPVDPLLKYLDAVESAFNRLGTGYFERYEEEIFKPERADLRIRVRFLNGFLLEWNEAVTVEKGHINHLAYRYHFQDKDNNLLFRYDNTPHFSHFSTFPHHKHLPDEVIAVSRPSAFEVIKEVKKHLM